MVRVKICGITNAEDAMVSVMSGADALGFVFFRESPRYITPDAAASIIRMLPPFVSTVGVFVNAPVERVREVVMRAGLTHAQLHGEESPEDCRALGSKAIKAFRVDKISDLAPIEKYSSCASAFLLDAYSKTAFGGTGMTFNWDVAVEAKRYGRIILAGGLTPENVADAVHRVQPYAVDTSSGVEAEKGRKDHHKVRMFIARAKASLNA